MGAITSVGRTADTACAAIRAGIARPRKVKGFALVDEESQERIALMGHPIQGYTEGFHLVGRWLRLAGGCLGELLAQPGLLPEASDKRFWASTLLIAVLPPLDADIFLSSEEQLPEVVRKAYLLPLLGMLERPIAHQDAKLVTVGHAGTALALQEGMQRLAGSSLERILLVSVDSWFDPLLLQRLANSRRLKCEESPTGLMPGEAGVCLLLESEAGARRRGAAVHAVVTGVATGQETENSPGGARGSARALSTCLRILLGRESKGLLPFRGDIYSDLNGEEWRALEWGSARVSLSDLLAEPRMHLPCAAVGDTGAASGALGVCLAAQDLRGRWARTGQSVVLSRSERGAVGSILLQAEGS
ncbi:hypothetical protein DAT35_15695 [Vitiosangium sp. GDMCC 1.1324]|nr:hypothetical protein DAT35_15695 [Vitiosangium sp. GDMCC 1.1324]